MKVWASRDKDGDDQAHLWDTEPFLQKGMAGDEFWSSKHSFLGEYDAEDWPWPVPLPERGECAVFTIEFAEESAK